MAKNWKEMNKEFQTMWQKHDRGEMDSTEISGYCADLETMVMNFLTENGVLDSTVLDTSYIKPCPFCGGTAETKHLVQGVYIQCKHCEVSSKSFMDMNDAISSWNARI